MKKMMKNLGPMMGAMGGGGGGTVSQARALRKMQKELGGGGLGAGGGDLMEQLAAMNAGDPMSMAGQGGPGTGQPRRNKKIPKRKKKKRR